jgi:hypothetical protein
VTAPRSHRTRDRWPPPGKERGGPPHQGNRPDTNNQITATNGETIVADVPTTVPVDYLEWRCRTGRCVDRPLHDCMDWWPAWSLEGRWAS